MNTMRKTAGLAGALYILAAITSIIGLLAYDPVLHDREYILEAPARATRVTSGAVCECVLAFSIIGISLALFPILRRGSEGLALGYACFRLLEATIIIVGIIDLLSVVTLSREIAPATASDASYLTAGRLLVAHHNWTFLFGPELALGPSTLIMSFFLFKSRLVPRYIATLGLVAGPLISLSAILVMFNVYDQVSAWGAVTSAPVFVYEMTLALRLITKGFDPTALASLNHQPVDIAASCPSPDGTNTMQS